MHLSLFGGDLTWSAQDWVSLDDTVRGGSSSSKLTCDASNPVAVFSGYLDIKTLGNAGFASQRTAGDDREWNLSNYDGITIVIKEADGKKFTFSLKDQLSPPAVDGREQSVVSWDYDFVAAKDGELRRVYWSDFKPTYRGRELKDTAPLDLGRIKRFSLMMRSFFGSQEGDFSLSLISISAFSCSNQQPYHDNFGDDDTSSMSRFSEKHPHVPPRPRSWLSRLLGNCI